MKTQWMRGLVLLSSLVLVASCGGSSGGGGGGGEPPVVTPVPINGSTIVKTSTTPNTNCPSGTGVHVEWGVDKNGNGALDADEVTGTGDICDGAPGTGTAIRVSAEPAGTHCAAGGVKVETGPDANGNGVPDSVTATSYVCNGATGGTGEPGSNGTATQVSTEPTGGSCGAAGGAKVETGPDADGNGVPDSVTATSYVCNGATGGQGSPGLQTLVNTRAITLADEDAPCTTGIRVDMGLDDGLDGLGQPAGLANDGLLAAGESSAHAYICDGTQGVSGFNALIVTSADTAHCPFGGVNFKTGVDDHAPFGTLDDTDTGYHEDWVCNTGAGRSEGTDEPVNLTPNTAHSAGVAATGASYYQFTTVGNTGYTISLTRTASDLKWTLYSNAGFTEVVATCDTVPGRAGDEACLTPILTDATPYYLKVEELSNLPNLFSLRVAEPFVAVAADELGDLWLLDPVTGDEQYLLNTFVPCEDCFPDLHRVSSMAYAGNGTLTAGRGGTGDWWPGGIVSIDPATGEAWELIANAGFSPSPYVVSGMAARPSDNRVFVTGNMDYSLPTVFFYGFDVNDEPPAPETLGVMSSTFSGPGNGLAFDEAGTLWLSNTFGLFTVNTTTGATSLQGKLRLLGTGPGIANRPGKGAGKVPRTQGPTTLSVAADSMSLASMAVNPADGRMYGLTNRWAATSNIVHLVTVDPVTRVAMDVNPLVDSSSLTYGGLDGLAFVPLRVMKDAFIPLNPLAIDLGGGTVAFNWETSAAVLPGTTYNVYYTQDAAMMAANGYDPAAVRLYGTLVPGTEDPALVVTGLAVLTDTWLVVTALLPGGVETGTSLAAYLSPQALDAGAVGAQLIVADSEGAVYELSPGAAPVLVMQMTRDSGEALLGPVSSMAWDAVTGQLIAGTGASNTLAGALFALDLSTGDAGHLYNTGYAEIPGLVFNSGDGLIYGIGGCLGPLFTFAWNGSDAWELTTQGGAGGGTTLCGGGQGLTFAGEGGLYQADSGTLYELVWDVEVAANPVATFSYVGFRLPLNDPKINSMGSRPGDGKVFGILNDGFDGAGPTYLVLIETNGTVTNLGRTGADFDGLTWLPAE